MAWQASGVSTIPILPNGTKRPATKWQEFQGRIPTVDEMNHWWGNGVEYGLALIMGRISGNLEMLEIEGKVMNEGRWSTLVAKMEELGLSQVFDNLMVDGYTEESPSGGLHMIYHISDNPVPGNEKIARRPATEAELAENPLDKIKVLAETRGEGGYVIVAPSPGLCHPSGKQWVKVFGEYGRVASISWDERNAIHAAIHDAIDEMPVAQLPALVASPQDNSPRAGSRPGDEWAATVRWSDLLERDGWTFSHVQGVEEYWVRPGKSRRDGHSATVNYRGSDLLKVFSSAVEGLEPESTYSKFGYLASVHFGGDFSRASQALVREGFGQPIEHLNQNDMKALIVSSEEPDAKTEKFFTLDEVGNAERLWEQLKDTYRWVAEEKCFRVWNGKTWEQNCDGAGTREWMRITQEMMRSPDTETSKWGKASRSTTRTRNAVSLMRDLPGCTKSAEVFDKDLEILNVENGLLDLRTGVLGPHDPDKMITRVFASTYNPEATCPNFEKFISEALPDPALRAYVQRALGYSLLGNADQRSLFIIHGPSGTGKSTLMETMRKIFGGYGTTAPAGTFKAKINASGPNNDLHRLRGKRFVTTSETTESSVFDEEMLKRLTGNDSMQTRNLYESFQEWSPECVIWMATNHPPRFTSDDNAIWSRVKLIPFLTQFTGENEVPDMADRFLVPEASGILNWLIVGLRDFMANGISMPETVSDSAQQLRMDSDPVVRFIEESVSDGILIEDANTRIRTVELHRMYLEWARATGEPKIGNRRFTNRMHSGTSYEIHKVQGHRSWHGLGRAPGVGILGTLFT